MNLDVIFIDRGLSGPMLVNVLQSGFEVGTLPGIKMD